MCDVTTLQYAEATQAAPVIVADSPSPVSPAKSTPRAKGKMPYKHRMDDSDSDDDVKPVAKRQSVVGRTRTISKPKYVEDSDDDVVISPKAKSKAGKAKVEVDDDVDSPLEAERVLILLVHGSGR